MMQLEHETFLGNQSKFIIYDANYLIIFKIGSEQKNYPKFAHKFISWCSIDGQRTLRCLNKKFGWFRLL